MYCDSYDGDLFIAEDPAREGLVVASGGSGHAFKFAPVLGAIVADVLEERDNRFASRFAWRRLGRVKTEQARYTGA
jgi:glycine/D-amino acid oxidase-like deaminating enzyme